MKIICIHQSADLYGSDRSFLQVIQYLIESNRFAEISVLLPRPGPLSDILQKKKINIHYKDLSLLSMTLLKKIKLGKIIFPLLKYKEKINLFNSYDIVYVNTSVILDFYLIAPYITAKKIIHIREIPSKWLSYILSLFIKRSKALVLFNSESTLKSFRKFSDSFVIHNAFEGFGIDKVDKIGECRSFIKILLIGRINNWKGQDFAIEALSRANNIPFQLRIVGNTSLGNESLLERLKDKVNKYSLEDKIEFIDFMPNPKEAYKWADIVIVPSIRPEPFGRIAIEAMSMGKPLVASKHGGLPEIIEHERNGFLFAPNNHYEFLKYIEIYFNNRMIRKIHSENSLNIYKQKFSMSNFYKKLDIIFDGKNLL